MFSAPESRHAQFRTNYLGKTPEEYDQNPSRTDVEKHCGRIIILDVSLYSLI